MKKIAALCLTLILTIVMIVPVSASGEAEGLIYTDLPDSNWAYEYIASMSELNILNGYSDGTFRPEAVMRRDEFAKVLSCMLDVQGIVPETGDVNPTLNDIDSNWAREYILNVCTYIPYSGTSFRPEDVITREDMVTAIIRAMDVDVSTADLLRAQNTFSDYNDITDSLKPYVAYSLEHDIVTGYTDGSFRPKEGVSRSVACAVLYRAFLQYPYAMNTVVSGLDGVCSMILTNENSLLYSDGRAVYQIGMDGQRSVMELDSKPEDVCLAYDMLHNITYLVLGDPLQVYDISDFSAPRCVYDISEHQQDLHNTSGKIDSTLYLHVMTDGSLLIPFEDNGTFRLNFKTMSLSSAPKAYYSGTSGYFFSVLDNNVYTFHIRDTNVTIKNILSWQESSIELEEEPPYDMIKVLSAGIDGFYFWRSGTGLMKIDRAGSYQVVAGLDQIENKDFSQFPNNVWNTCINVHGSFAIYDNTLNSILLIYENEK